MPFPPDKTKQFAVQFACRIPARKELSAAERKALENILRDLDPEMFQIFHEEHNVANLFQASRQHHVGPATITAPSFIFANDSVTLLSLIEWSGSLLRNRTVDTSPLNKKMAHILFEIQNTLKGLRYHRAGKIFEFVIGPFNPEDKRNLLPKLMMDTLADIGELNITFAKYVKLDEEMYNFQTVILYNQLELGHPFDLVVRVDINNRQLAESMDPGEIEKVWGRADKAIAEHLDSIIGYTS